MMDPIHILHIEDDVESHELLRISLGKWKRQPLQLDWAKNRGEILKSLQFAYSVVFLDLNLGLAGKGFDWIPQIRKSLPHSEIIILSSETTFESAQKALRAGASDFLAKGYGSEEVRYCLDQALKRLQWKKLERNVQREAKKALKNFAMVGRSKSFRQMISKLEKLAPSSLPILIQGETGTGKELVANWIHLKGSNAEGPFVPVNCGAIPANLGESFFFGHEKGAFTGASQQSIGAFEESDGGTLFLDEVNSLSLEMQAKVLRAIQEHEIRRVGGKQTIPVQFRLLAAANEDLEKMVEKKLFREDLYYRLATAVVEVPALRDRKEDIELLANFFAGGHSISPDLLSYLEKKDWRGNVRELQNIIQRLKVLYPDQSIFLLEHLQESFIFGGTLENSERRVESKKSLEHQKEQIEIEFLRDQYDTFRKNVSEMARSLKMDRSHLHHKLVRFGIHKISRR